MPYKGKLALAGTVLTSILLSLRLWLKRKDSMRGKENCWHLQGMSIWPRDALWHPRYSFALRLWLLPSSFWYLRLAVSLLVKAPKKAAGDWGEPFTALCPGRGLWWAGQGCPAWIYCFQSAGTCAQIATERAASLPIWLCSSSFRGCKRSRTPINQQEESSLEQGVR